MSVQPLDFLESANAMCGDNPAEIDLRNAASRSYYFAYHTAVAIKLEYAPDRPLNNDVGNHQALIDCLTKLPSDYPKCMLLRKIGHLLSQMKLIRVDADYDLAQAFDVASLEELRASLSTMKGHISNLQNPHA